MLAVDRDNVLDLFDESWRRETRAVGENVILEGKRGDFMYVVEAGLLELTASGQLLDMVRAGDVVGEMSLIDGEPRSASASVVQEAVLIPIDQAAFRSFVAAYPDFALYVMQSLAGRVRRMNDVIIQA